MSFSGSFYKTPCWCTSPPPAIGSDAGKMLWYANIIISGYWYQTAPQLYDALGRPVTVVSFDDNFGNLTYTYKIFTKGLLDRPLSTLDAKSVLCGSPQRKGLELYIMTYDDIVPQVSHKESGTKFQVERVKREAGRTFWRAAGC